MLHDGDAGIEQIGAFVEAGNVSANRMCKTSLGHVEIDPCFGRPSAERGPETVRKRFPARGIIILARAPLIGWVLHVARAALPAGRQDMADASGNPMDEGSRSVGTAAWAHPVHAA